MDKLRSLKNPEKKITAIGLGAMPLSLQGRPDEALSIKIIESFIEDGGNFIDTANVYCIDDTEVGHNERLIHKAISNFEEQYDIIIATKGGLKRPKGRWDVDASPEWLRQSCEKSLKDLNIDSIHIYQLHAPDPNIPLSDSIGELVRLKEEGKIRAIGLSNVNNEELEIALTITPITSVQNKFNIFERMSLRNGVIENCKKKNILFIAHSPVGGHFGHGMLAECKTLTGLAKKYYVSPYQIALAWLLQQGEHILPIPGASKISSIKDSLKALDILLEQEDLDLITSLSD